ncbi:MAG: HD domain-containing protein [Saprospiraceae bacterium]|nr:HD domain-containing protein [Saprospiraceae bacterium]
MKIIEHPYFQRLRRIKQLGLTHYVYPGAVHTRFNHALGAFHLMTEALSQLRQKEVPITQEEKEAAQLAILLHDVGHGPFSHVLEHSLINVQHESITLWIMEFLNSEFKGQLDLCIELFKGQYPKKFLHQLITSQLDVDRLDYLKRDSFYTGVVEGNIGIDRLINMMNVVNNELVLEEKSIYTVEKFLASRRIMYLQVYLHKAALVAEKMLKHLLSLISERKNKLDFNLPILQLMDLKINSQTDRINFLNQFILIDDIDIWSLLKMCKTSSDLEIAQLSDALINRKLLKINVSDSDLFDSTTKTTKLKNLHFKIDFRAYDPTDGEILFKAKDESVYPLSSVKDFQYLLQNTTRHYTIK